MEVNAPANLDLLKKGLKGNAHVTELRLPGLTHALQITKEIAGFEAPFSSNALNHIQDWLKA